MNRVHSLLMQFCLAFLTSNHSVAPTLPYSPALQLANTILLLGLNPSIKVETQLIKLMKPACSLAAQYLTWSVRPGSFYLEIKNQTSAADRCSPFSTMSEMERASSTRTLVPTVDAPKPGPHASLWAPMTTYRSADGHRTFITRIVSIFPDHRISLIIHLCCTCIHKAFDDPKDIIYPFLSKDIVDFHSNNIALISESIDAPPTIWLSSTPELPVGCRQTSTLYWCPVYYKLQPSFWYQYDVCESYLRMFIPMPVVIVWAKIFGRPEDCTGGNWVWLKEGKPGV